MDNNSSSYEQRENTAVVSAVQRTILNGYIKPDKHWNLARVLKILWNTKVMNILITIATFETFLKDLFKD